MSMRSAVVAMGLMMVACGPRISVKREQPARVDLGADSRVLTVSNVHHESVLGVLTDPLGALARTTLTPRAVRQLEAQLAKSPRYQVIPRCGDVCPAADTRVEVSITNVHLKAGNVKTGASKEGEASLAVRVLKRNGQVAWENSYRRWEYGGTPGSQDEMDDHTLLSRCVDSAVDGFVRDLHPQWIYESFRMEDEGVLQDCAKKAAAGDLDGAEAAAREVLTAQPENAKAIYNLGAIFTARGQLEQALEAFKAAAQRDSKYVPYRKAAERRLADRGTLEHQSQ